MSNPLRWNDIALAGCSPNSLNSSSIPRLRYERAGATRCGGNGISQKRIDSSYLHTVPDEETSLIFVCVSEMYSFNLRFHVIKSLLREIGLEIIKSSFPKTNIEEFWCIIMCIHKYWNIIQFNHFIVMSKAHQFRNYLTQTTALLKERCRYRGECFCETLALPQQVS